MASGLYWQSSGNYSVPGSLHPAPSPTSCWSIASDIAWEDKIPVSLPQGAATISKVTFIPAFSGRAVWGWDFIKIRPCLFLPSLFYFSCLLTDVFWEIFLTKSLNLNLWPNICFLDSTTKTEWYTVWDLEKRQKTLSVLRYPCIGISRPE